MAKKKRNKNKKNIKAQILHAGSTFSSAATSTATSGTALTASTVAASSASSVAVNNDSDKYHTHHVYTDLKFFFGTTGLIAVILIAIYFWDQSSGIILTAGQGLYGWLGIS